jgi:hypothetical protein
MRNSSMAGAFEKLPGSVLSTKIGKLVFEALQRKAIYAIRRQKHNVKKSGRV